MPTNKPIVRMDDRIWRKVLGRCVGLGKLIAKIGYFTGELDEEGFSILERAAIHEFGSEDGTIPERSFIRAGLAKAQETGELRRICSSLCGDVIYGRKTEETAIKILAEWAVSYIRAFVKEGEHIPPPLKQATIDAKGSDRPLVDTGEMINRLTSQIEDA